VDKSIFNEIEGYDEIKERIINNLQDGAKPVHFLFWGPPATAKTQFLDALNQLDGSYKMLGGGTTKVGAFEVLASRKPRILIIDEIDKMKAEHQGLLLGLMENQEVLVDKHNAHIHVALPDTRVYASANNIKRVSEALRSRFICLYFKEYSEAEFKRVVVRVLMKEGYEHSFSQSVASLLWNKGITDVRQARQIARLAGVKENIRATIDLVLKYK